MLGKLYFFFSSRRRHTRFDCDWSSDVCSSDLPDDATLLEAIQATRTSIWAQQFPVMLAVIDVLKLAVETLREIREADPSRSEERRVGKECRSRWSPYL